jgi:hypothetical protein
MNKSRFLNRFCSDRYSLVGHTISHTIDGHLGIERQFQSLSRPEIPGSMCAG